MAVTPSSESFLSLVARDLISRFGQDLAGVAVIFPSRRARLFFNNILYQQAQKPVWAPSYYSVEELFQQMTTLHPADPIKLVCELYKAYLEVYNSKSDQPSSETLDEFYSFGETLLNDFDDIDKHLVNARSLFSNLQDLDLLKDDFLHLSSTQQEALSHYFRQTFQGDSSLQAAFWSIWSMLGEVYQLYRSNLEKEQIAYPGMLMRRALEENDHQFREDHYVFVGFNVLNKCEEQLFRRMKDKALFYWDTDSYYLDKENNEMNEAGTFLAENIRKLGSAIDWKGSEYFLSSEKEITIIASPSENGQSAAIPGWIDSLNCSRTFSDPDSAIVLCNEQILPTVMHSISPDKVANVNITMGFPITQTPVSSFIQVLGDLQLKGSSGSGSTFMYKYVLPVLRHPYTQMVFPEAKAVEIKLVQGNIFFPSQDELIDRELFGKTKTASELANYLLSAVQRVGHALGRNTAESDIYGGLYQESVFRSYQIINRLYGLLLSGELQIEKTTFLRLLKKLLATTPIPFHGEPVKGLQVMGVLETRVLDFKNLILLSVNEGFMPGSSNDNTFIPQFLRKHFGLSTLEHQDSVYAYYFYRLLQRTEKVTLVYNTDKTQTGKAEMSRFILQLLMDPRLNIRRFSIQSSIKPIQTEPIEIIKDKLLMEKIRQKYDGSVNPEARALSPSALNVLIDCSLCFYYQYIEELKSKEELSDELDSAVFGTIFHKAAELLYRRIGNIDEQSKNFSPFLVQKEQLEFFTENLYLLDKLINQAFSEIYFKGRRMELKQYNGEQLINFRVVRHLLLRLIELDKKRAPFYIHGLEHKVYGVFNLKRHGVSLKVGGIIDRLEEKDGSLLIVDYKTSGTAKPYKSMEDLVIPKELRASHVFQTFTYASVLAQNEKYRQPIVPALLYLQEAGKDHYSPVIPYEKEPIMDFRNLKESFEEVFVQKIAELFDSEIPFCQTTVVSKCSYCDFKNLCNR